VCGQALWVSGIASDMLLNFFASGGLIWTRFVSAYGIGSKIEDIVTDAQGNIFASGSVPGRSRSILAPAYR
jgi:hypothetical protein